MSTVAYPHISVGADKVPMIEGTKIKVIEIVLDHLAHGSDPREMQRQLPHLSLAQIHSALAYYYDHEEEMDDEIARRLQRSEVFREELKRRRGESKARLKLKTKGLIP